MSKSTIPIILLALILLGTAAVAAEPEPEPTVPPQELALYLPMISGKPVPLTVVSWHYQQTMRAGPLREEQGRLELRLRNESAIPVHSSGTVRYLYLPAPTAGGPRENVIPAFERACGGCDPIAGCPVVPVRIEPASEAEVCWFIGGFRELYEIQAWGVPITD